MEKHRKLILQMEVYRKINELNDGFSIGVPKSAIALVGEVSKNGRGSRI